MKLKSVATAFALAVLCVGSVPTVTYAGPVKITQTMTKAQLKKSCAVNGGTYSDDGSYGSSCIGNKGSVSCNTKGKCTGYIPD